MGIDIKGGRVMERDKKVRDGGSPPSLTFLHRFTTTLFYVDFDMLGLGFFSLREPHLQKPVLEGG